MKLTDTQRKWLWIAGIALVVLHFAPRFIATIRQAANPPAPPKPSAAHVAQVEPAVVIVPPVITVDPQITNAMGIWLGQTVRPDQATSCLLRLELKPTPLKPGDYTGYSTMSCGPTLALIGQRISQSGEAKAILTQMMPVSTILTGPAMNGALQLHASQTIGAPHDGCTVTDLTLTPFGDNNISVKWLESPETCHGGDMLLRRSPR
jgi:hypothetical protein